MKASLLVIDDEESLGKALVRFLSDQGYDVMGVKSGEDGLKLLKKHSFDLLLVDLMLSQESGIEVMKKAREICPSLITIVMTGFGTIASAVEAIRMGAYHYVTKPFDLDDIGSLIQKAIEHHQLRHENRELKKQLKEKFGFENIIGQSEPIKNVFRLVEKVADSDSTILILGESGTGKELLAKAIHFRSRRAEQPFVVVNCGAIPEGLLESELFGHVRGAFTGAVANQIGKFELANQGTLFLDEIGEMSPQLQVKLLRVLQERVVVSVGSSKTKEVNARVIAATNQDLAKAIEENRFREDLYYRLNVIPIEIPPLRERKEDIKILLDHFLKKFNEENHKQVSAFDPSATQFLLHYSWPGNVRELENLVQRLVVIKSKGVVSLEDLPLDLQQKKSPSFIQDFVFSENGIHLKHVVDQFEYMLIRKALIRSEGNKNKAAQLLQMNRTTLIEKIRKMEDGKH